VFIIAIDKGLVAFSKVLASNINPAAPPPTAAPR
jgi:hypothetical protein